MGKRTEEKGRQPPVTFLCLFSKSLYPLNTAGHPVYLCNPPVFVSPSDLHNPHTHIFVTAAPVRKNRPMLYHPSGKVGLQPVLAFHSLSNVDHLFPPPLIETARSRCCSAKNLYSIIILCPCTSVIILASNSLASLSAPGFSLRMASAS